MKRFMPYLWPIVLCLFIGFSASFLQKSALVEWYPFLRQSPLTPLDSAFPIVWILLYILMGISLGRIWNSPLKVSKREWWIQLGLNLFWNIAFFYARQPLWSFLIILILDVVVLDYMIVTLKKDKVAAGCFAPYFLWLVWSTYLNAYIYIYN
ncbi:MAG: tryptophan-rich sensory protein [Paraprevotella sp.]|nr:tryptophan-rich sensory protein [Paraprevotella sp.]